MRIGSLAALLLPLLASACTRGSTGAPSHASATAVASPRCDLAVNAFYTLYPGVAPPAGAEVTGWSMPVPVSVMVHRGKALLATRSFQGTACFDLADGPVTLTVETSAPGFGCEHEVRVVVPGKVDLTCGGPELPSPQR